MEVTYLDDGEASPDETARVADSECEGAKPVAAGD
jgi:hypothetical protein